MEHRASRTLAVSAFPDGVTYIVWIDVLDEQGNETGQRQTIEGVVASSEEDAVDKIMTQLKAQMN